MTCYQVTVTGSGTANPAGVKFPVCSLLYYHILVSIQGSDKMNYFMESANIVKLGRL